VRDPKFASHSRAQERVDNHACQQCDEKDVEDESKPGAPDVRRIIEVPRPGLERYEDPASSESDDSCESRTQESAVYAKNATGYPADCNENGQQNQ
jgi:hypothetical protein